jgi:hypothetical protein
MADPRTVLDLIISDLNNPAQEKRLAAIDLLWQTPFSSAAILNLLERTATSDPSPEVRKAALEALQHPAHRAIQQNLTRLRPDSRRMLIQEAQNWARAGIISAEQAEIIRRKYDFDQVPPLTLRQRATEHPTPSTTAPPPAPVTKAAPAPQIPPTPYPVSQPAPAPSPQASAPRPTLLQTLTSETSIKIALYLGAFMVIAAAFILAFLSETLRFPALITVTLGFGIAAVVLKKRLPPTSFTLFIVASVLLVIDAIVFRDILNLSGQAASIYWSISLGLMVLIWCWATWLYRSRFFTLTAFSALAASLQFGINIFNTRDVIFHVLAASVAALIGILACKLLKKWQNTDFVIPFFAILQGFQVLLLTTGFIAGLVNITKTNPAIDWTVLAIVGGLAAVFYIISDGLFSFMLFPWLAVGALLPIQGLITHTSHPAIWIYGVGAWAWGFAMLISSELTLRSKTPSLKSYSLPLNISANLLMLGGALFGFAENAATGFGLSLAAALIMSAAHIRVNRWWVWLSAIWFGLMAYISAFSLIETGGWLKDLPYKVAAATALFALIDLVLKPSFQHQKSWRWPLRAYGLLFIVANTIYLIISTRHEHQAILLALHGVIALAYAIRYNKPIAALIFTIHIPLAAIFALEYFQKLDDLSIIAGTILALTFYLAGFFIRRINGSKHWSSVFRYSALGIALLMLLPAFIYYDIKYTGWYLLILSGLFIAETLGNRFFELGFYPLAIIGYAFILDEFRLYHTVFIPGGITATMLAADMFFHKAKPRRFYGPLIRLGSISPAMLTISAMLLNQPSWQQSWVLGLLALLYIFVAWYYRASWVLYVSNLYIGFGIFAGLRVLGQVESAWLPAVSVTAYIFYLTSYLLNKKRETLPAWGQPYRFSSLLLAIAGSILSIYQPVKASGIYTLLLAVLLVIETLKNPIFEITIYLLSGISYFHLLEEFGPDWLKTPALAIAIFTLIIIALELAFHRLLTPRPWKWISRLICGLTALVAIAATYLHQDARESLAALGLLSALALIVTLFYRQPLILYILTGTFALLTSNTLFYLEIDRNTWLPILTGLSMFYYAAGIALLRTRLSIKWSHPLRYSALILGAILTISARDFIGGWAGWYLALIAWLFLLETFRNSRFEPAVHIGFSAAYYFILKENHIANPALNLMGPAIIVFCLDTFFERAIERVKTAYVLSLTIGSMLGLAAALVAVFPQASGWQNTHALVGLATLSLALAITRQKPLLGYGTTSSLALAVFVGARTINPDGWLWPLTALSTGYYITGFLLLKGKKNAPGQILLASGLTFSTLATVPAPLLISGISPSVPVAITATIWAAEAFRRRNVWLGFPANILYLMAYSIILFESGIREAQYYSLGAGLLGMLMHYLLRRSGNKIGTFITGMVSQLILLGTAYVQMVSTQELSYFAALFFEGLAVLVYGLVIRSRSLVFAPIIFIIVGIITVIFSLFRDLSSVIMIGGTGILLIILGTAALLLRERIAEVRERLNDWEA